MPLTLDGVEDQNEAMTTARFALLTAHLLAGPLDRDLAQGRSRGSGRRLAARSELLASPATRRALANDWANLLERARTPALRRSPRVSLNRARIIDCEPDIKALITAVQAPQPPSARGLAMASELLRDGTGPLYNRRRAHELGLDIAAVLAALAPARLRQDDWRTPLNVSRGYS
jgi:hypothetical protein